MSDTEQFKRAVDIARQDLNWLNEKALGTLFGSNAPRLRIQVEERRQRIDAVLSAVPQILQLQKIDLQQLHRTVESLRESTLEAIIGLRDFLQTLALMEMPEGARSVVEAQLESVQTALGTMYSAQKES